MVPPPVFAAFPCVFPPRSRGSCWERFAGLSRRMNFLLSLCPWSCAVLTHRWQHPQEQRCWAVMANPFWEGDSLHKVASAPYLLMFLIFQHEIMPLILQRKKNSFHWGNEYCISCSVTKTAVWWIFVLLQMQMVLSGNHF